MPNAFEQLEEFPLSLLDRLRDDHPREQTEPAHAAAVTCGWEDYRAALGRDLEWLLNTVHRRGNEERTLGEEVARSTWNFGVPEVCGSAATTFADRRWERAFAEALVRFEPRLREETLQVRIRPAESGQPANQLLVEITADLVVAPIRLSWRVRIDRETASAEIQGLTAGAA